MQLYDLPLVISLNNQLLTEGIYNSLHDAVLPLVAEKLTKNPDFKSLLIATINQAISELQLPL